ncbi:MAG: hypothetical protein ACRCU3_04555 [Eubacteriaceae bacterium]
MELNFVKVDPCGNTTAYILDPIPRSLYVSIAKQLIQQKNLCVEQVGFIEKPENKEAHIRLHMQGGEFCGNATRGLATWLSARKFPLFESLDEKTKVYKIEVSGSKEILSAKIVDTNLDHIKFASVHMPLPLKIFETLDYTLVIFEGIYHAIAWNIKPSIEFFHKVSQDVIQKHGNYQGLGMMFYDEKEQTMTPLVHIPAIDEIIWESSCGSGSAALGSALAQKKQSSIIDFKIIQPGGTITIDALWDGRIKEIILTSPIAIVSQGTVFIDL